MSLCEEDSTALGLYLPGSAGDDATCFGVADLCSTDKLVCVLLSDLLDFWFVAGWEELDMVGLTMFTEGLCLPKFGLIIGL